MFSGRFHAGIVTNNESWETACLKAGRVSGDLVHAMPYTPELHFGEFSSALADMKNSVAVSMFVSLCRLSKIFKSNIWNLMDLNGLDGLGLIFVL